MKSNARQPSNPLNMRQLGDDGPFVLPSIACTQMLTDFLTRGNRILGFYFAVSLYSEKGKEYVEQIEKTGKLKPDTTIRSKIEPQGLDIRLTYRLLKKQFSQAGAQLTNNVFLSVYGNFEAYILDVLSLALKQLGDPNPEDEAVKLILGTGWQGKFSRIIQKLGVSLGKARLVNKFHNLDMGFLGEKCVDPIYFLDRMADFRHRLVHSSGRVDGLLIQKYPKANLKTGDLLELPFGLPQGIHFFFVMLAEVVDEEFATKFNWTRSMVAPEKLID
ncbi:hypothetical protein KA005_14110 [bacterium]|nr:hypothetical protein [bacterium]